MTYEIKHGSYSVLVATIAPVVGHKFQPIVCPFGMRLDRKQFAKTLRKSRMGGPLKLKVFR